MPTAHLGCAPDTHSHPRAAQALRSNTGTIYTARSTRLRRWAGVCAYGRSAPFRFVDQDGRFAQILVVLCLENPAACGGLIITTAEIGRRVINICMAPIYKDTKQCKKEMEKCKDKCAGAADGDRVILPLYKSMNV